MKYFNNRIYASPVTPENYPNYKERQFPAVTRAALNDQVQFTSARAFTVDPVTNRFTKLADEIDMYADYGKVLWPVYTSLFVDNFDELVEEAAKRGMFIFDFWGYVPGNQRKPDVIWGEYEVPEAAKAALFDKLGSHFIGFDNGEQDGRYVYFAAQASPVGEDRRYQYKRFQRHFEKLGNAMENYITVLASLTYLHYFAVEGNSIMLGAETGQALPNNNMWFAFIRGAAKQYGLLCFGNASVWNRWGFKSYDAPGEAPGYTYGPDKGTSLSLLRRLMYNQYMYNCDMLGFEQSQIMNENVEKRITNVPIDLDSSNAVPSPVGRIQQNCARFIAKNGRPGTMYVPVAVITDFFSGWTPPRHLYVGHVYKVWGNLPFRTGDYQLHALFDMLFPGYVNASFFDDERGFQSPTPYGEIVDVLLNDAAGEIIDRYNVALLLSDTPLTLELYDKLKSFVKAGGRLIAFYDTVKKYAQGLMKYDANVADFFGLDNITYGSVSSKATVEVKAPDDAPLVISASYGDGGVTLFMSPEGAMVKAAGELTAENRVGKEIAKPYDFEDYAKKYLGGVFTELSLVAPDNAKLHWCVGVKNSSEMTLFVENDNMTNEWFSIKSDKYSIESVTELPVEDGIPQDENFHTAAFKADNTRPQPAVAAYNIDAGDIKLFSLVVKPKSAELNIAPESNPTRKVDKLYVSINASGMTIKDYYLLNPTFRQHFTGMLVQAEYFENMDEEAARIESEFLNRQKVKVLVDFSNLTNHFPDLSFVRNLPGTLADTKIRIAQILNKAKYYDTTGIIVSGHRKPEGNQTSEETFNGLMDTFKEIKTMAGAVGINTYFQNRQTFLKVPELFDSTSKNVKGANFAYNASNGIYLNNNAEELAAAYPVKGWLISAPKRDIVGQVYNVYSPVAGSEYEETLRGLIAKAKADSGAEFIALNADYSNWDEVYADLKLYKDVK